MQVFEHACCATKGARAYQEDTALVHSGAAVPAGAPDPDAPAVLAVLADGMGGHAGGALASSIACEEFLANFARERGSARQRLLGALNAANAAIGAKVAETPMLSGMGCTLVGASFGREGVEWVSVGDSPLLLFRRGEIAALNEDHSLAPELDRQAAAGKITFEEARRDPRRHMLRSAVTGDDIELVDISRRALPLAAGDYVILASDGIHTLSSSELERIVAASAEEGAQAVANAIIRAVEVARAPHQDNATVVVVRCCGI
jgi:PPM family protein phosphatase